MASQDPFSARARTKIVATVGPACRAPKQLAELAEAGVDVFRLNMAHGELEEHTETVAAIRAISRELGRPLAMLVDLSGPKIRLGELLIDPLECHRDEEYVFLGSGSPLTPQEFTCNYEHLVDELSPGDDVMLADGTVSLRVIEKGADRIRCRVVGPGTLRSRQGINLPGIKLRVPSITPADERHARWAAEQGVDFVSLSFVRSQADVWQLKDLLRGHGSSALVIAKIEKREALAELEDIVNAADGVMVARGDLGVEIDVAETAVVQKRIIGVCRKVRRPVIVATQMLDSMQQTRRPTRAEVSDVTNAILDGADACMLSGETAVGRYPIEAVRMMNRIMLASESTLRNRPLQREELEPADTRGVHPVSAAVVYGAGRIAEHLQAGVVVIATRTGGTAMVKSKHRDFIPTIGVSDSETALSRMCLYWGITPLRGAPIHDLTELRHFVSEWALADGCVTHGDRVVFVTGAGLAPQSQAHNTVVVFDVE